jgi:hypothetical protein
VLSGEEHVAGRFAYFHFFDTIASDRSTNVVAGMLVALEDKRPEINVHAAAQALTTHIFKEPGAGKGDGVNPDRPRSDMNIKEIEQRDKNTND